MLISSVQQSPKDPPHNMGTFSEGQPDLSAAGWVSLPDAGGAQVPGSVTAISLS